MCGRYFIAEEHSEAEMQRIINEVNRRNSESGIKTSGEVFPTDKVPVVAVGKSDRIGAFAMEWGYTAHDGRRIINARSETAAEKSMFADGMKARRCLVPASNYFEWEKKGKERTKHAVRGKGGMIWMAGIYRFEDKKPVFTILTREPAGNISFIHDRMPVLLEGKMREMWLDRNVDAGYVLERACLDVDFEPISGQIAMF